MEEEDYTSNISSTTLQSKPSSSSSSSSSSTTANNWFTSKDNKGTRPLEEPFVEKYRPEKVSIPLLEE